MQSNTDRVAQLEQKCLDLQQSVTNLHQDYDEPTERHPGCGSTQSATRRPGESSEKEKSEDCRFPEGVEGKDVVAFLEKWLPSILVLSGTSEIERAKLHTSEEATGE